MTKFNLWRFLHSRKFTLVLLFIFIFFIALGVVIPQQNIDLQQYKLWALENPQLAKIAAFLALDRVFAAWYFYLLSVLLFVNTLLCTLRQVKTIHKINRLNTFLTNSNFCRAGFDVSRNSDDILARTAHFYRARHYQTVIIEPEKSGDEVILASKGQWGKWGVIIFHLGILIILGSVFYGALTKIEGTTYLGVGQTFTEGPQDYFKLKHGWIYSENSHLNFQMTLVDTKLDYSQGYPDVNKLKLTFWDNINGATDYEGNGENISYRGTRVYIENVGYAPAIVFTDEKNEVLYGTFKKVETAFHLGNRVTYRDELDVPQLDLKLFIDFYPDAVINGKQIFNRSQQPKNPALHLKITRQSQIIFDGNLKPGSRVKLAGNLFLNFPEYRNWVSFRLVRDKSPAGIFSGFFIGLVGLAVYYLVMPQKYLVEVRSTQMGKTVSISGYTDKFRAYFKDRFKVTLKELREELNNMEGPRDV